jgi:hypothetical protein
MPQNLPACALEMPVLYLDGQIHYGLAATVTANDKLSTIMIPDITKLKEGQPVYITGRIEIAGVKLNPFLKNKGVELPKEINELLNTTTISCDAFYYSKNMVTYKKGEQKLTDLKKRLGLDDAKFTEWLTPHKKTNTDNEYEIDEGPLLMIFSIKFDKGLIAALSGDEHFSDFFDITSGHFRIVRCMPDKADILKDYLKQLQ